MAEDNVEIARPRQRAVSRLERARVYFVCEARHGGTDSGRLLREALANGVDMIQLRDKELGDAELAEAAVTFRGAADEHEALFLLNDRPDLVERCDADGAHIGQDDMTPAEARALLPTDALLGLSTHSREQIEAAQELGDEAPDYLSVGPIWETPTKQGRPAVGLELIDTAARIARLPWFAIGGIDHGNVGEVVAAGARRIVVVRAIRDADDPAATARLLRDAVEAASETRG
jgi:thiamine-phosphate pyrophosphorylase